MGFYSKKEWNSKKKKNNNKALADLIHDESDIVLKSSHQRSLWIIKRFLVFPPNRRNICATKWNPGHAQQDKKLAVKLTDIAHLLWLTPAHGNCVRRPTRTRNNGHLWGALLGGDSSANDNQIRLVGERAATDENTAPIGTDGLDYRNHHERGPFRSPRGAVCLLFLDNSHPQEC